MQILVVIAHYFKPEKTPRYASERSEAETSRRENVERIIRTWRGVFGEHQYLQIDEKKYEAGIGPAAKIDLQLVHLRDHSLVTSDFATEHGVRLRQVEVANPRMLPFAAHHVFKENKSGYDWFVYSEDDILVSDPTTFLKLNAFNKQFGYKRVLQPNRFELNAFATKFKTYIDGNLNQKVLEIINPKIEDENYLNMTALDTKIALRRARNPHSGCFFLNAEQIDYWARQANFLDMDVSFISPLESAASLGISKNFSIYKPFGRESGFFEVQHLGNDYSALNTQ
jgi:hypothetical protein